MPVRGRWVWGLVALIGSVVAIASLAVCYRGMTTVPDLPGWRELERLSSLFWCAMALFVGVVITAFGLLGYVFGPRASE